MALGTSFDNFGHLTHTMLRFSALSLALLLTGCSSGIYTLTTHFDESNVPPAPDYSRPEAWAAHPSFRDAADSVPKGSQLTDGQREAKADVFFVYPTIFTGKPADRYDWNANMMDPVLNRQVQETTILNQASIFNGYCRVYSPYYRQAHYSVFLTSDPRDKERALALAYEDVRNAFRYYLEHYNDGRPIVIASHSQGSLHAEHLLQEFFDGTPLQSRLVAAYLPGRAVRPEAFRHLPASSLPEQTGCYASWCTFIDGYYPEKYATWYKGAVTTNPLTWNSAPEYAASSMNLGGVGLGFRFVPRFADAQSKDGILWIHKPNVKGKMFIHVNNWHRADMNLFYVNIRENSGQRIEQFLKQQATSGR